MNRVFIVILLLMGIFAWMDYKQVTTIREINAIDDMQKWETYWALQQPATVFMWSAVLVAFGIAWYLVSKDKSEAIKEIVKEYIEMENEPELKPEFIAKMKKIEKQKVIRVNNFAKRYGLKNV